MASSARSHSDSSRTGSQHAKSRCPSWLAWKFSLICTKQTSLFSQRTVFLCLYPVKDLVKLLKSLRFLRNKKQRKNHEFTICATNRNFSACLSSIPMIIRKFGKKGYFLPVRIQVKQVDRLHSETQTRKSWIRLSIFSTRDIQGHVFGSNVEHLAVTWLEIQALWYEVMVLCSPTCVEILDHPWPTWAIQPSGCGCPDRLEAPVSGIEPLTAVCVRRIRVRLTCHHSTPMHTIRMTYVHARLIHHRLSCIVRVLEIKLVDCTFIVIHY